MSPGLLKYDGSLDSPRLFLIDTFGFIFRAYHARARTSAVPMRTGTGIPTEATFIFNNMLRKLRRTYNPQYIAAIFESEGVTLREQSFKDYKANRTAMPPDLAQQIPYVERLLEAMRVPMLRYPGFEADDVIGTIARRAVEAGAEVVIVSSDKDMLQLVTDKVSMLNPAKDDLWYDPAKVKEAMGVEPARIADLLALKGDAVDNIPGAPGIGDKGAQELIARFGAVETVLERAAEVPRKMYRESLLANRDQVLLSKQLATIEVDVPIEFSLASVAACEPDNAALRQIYKELEFHSALRELGSVEDGKPRDYETLAGGEAAREWMAGIPKDARVAMALDRDAVGLSWRQGEARSIPLSQVEALRGLLEDPARAKVACDAKAALLQLADLNVEARGFTDDAMLYAFLLDSDPAGCSLEDLALRHFDLRIGPSAAERADRALELAEKLRPQVEARGLWDLYRTIDLPLAPVLARMERTGITVDANELSRLSRIMEEALAQLTSDIHALAGRPFNIASPQQLGKVLFEEMMLPAPQRYGKGKTISTAADVLEELAGEHEIVRKALEYRQLSKLKGTYVDALPALIRPSTGRLHTSFNQAGAATGRLSSSNPNLQNIPIRTDLGREIRAAFVPREGWNLVVADYSQIELRLLAHYSHDPVFVEAFRTGQDIHTRTAAEVFGVFPEMVNGELRRRAKAVNFGIVYGISSFGLAGQLGISRAEADAYIKKYFARHPGVRQFIENAILRVRETGMAKTLFGRERAVPDILSRNPNARHFAERVAVNSPLQGTAADLIKLAMIRIDHALCERGFRSAMLLQVHDELVFEAPPEETEELTQLVKREMENVHPLEAPLLVETGVGANWRDAK
ncbi:MAG: DNA polymerase I [Bryobacteraceae bacterium]